MSTNLSWRPYDVGWKVLNDKLKFALRKTDYDCQIERILLYENHIPFFKGLLAAGVKDAGNIITAIEKYGTIELKEIN